MSGIEDMRLVVAGDYLCEQSEMCTCEAATLDAALVGSMHQPGCGLTPIAPLAAVRAALAPAVGGDQTTETRHSATIEEVREVEAERDDQELRAILAETRIRNALRGLLLGGCTHQARFRIAIRALTDGEDEKAAIAAALNDEEQQ